MSLTKEYIKSLYKEPNQRSHRTVLYKYPAPNLKFIDNLSNKVNEIDEIRSQVEFHDMVPLTQYTIKEKNINVWFYNINNNHFKPIVKLNDGSNKYWMLETSFDGNCLFDSGVQAVEFIKHYQNKLPLNTFAGAKVLNEREFEQCLEAQRLSCIRKQKDYALAKEKKTMDEIDSVGSASFTSSITDDDYLLGIKNSIDTTALSVLNVIGSSFIDLEKDSKEYQDKFNQLKIAMMDYIETESINYDNNLTNTYNDIVSREVFKGAPDKLKALYELKDIFISDESSSTATISSALDTEISLKTSTATTLFSSPPSSSVSTDITIDDDTDTVEVATAPPSP